LRFSSVPIFQRAPKDDRAFIGDARENGNAKKERGRTLSKKERGRNESAFLQAELHRG
jgi:hypothetical protein